MIGTRLGAYDVLAEVGSGGMGVVYRAEVLEPVAGLEVGGSVAVKVVHPHLLQQRGAFKRFLREAEIGQSIRHENVVRCFDCDALTIDGHQQHFLVMEYLEGQTLRELLEDLERVPEELCRHIGREVATGLDAIHRAGVVHRDLKPENVLLTPTHVVKIMDLGVARLQDEAIRLSQTGHFVGSINYAAPEQFGPSSVQIDGRADLHALGATLYELATGVHPFHDADPRAVLRRVLEDDPRPCSEINPQLSPFFEEVIHTLLQKDRDERIASAAELRAILSEGEEGVWWHERARSLRERTKRPLRRVRIPRETALYGRDEDLARLNDLYEHVKQGEGQVLLVEGEAGVGKTRLVDEFVARLQQEGEDLNFLFGSYLPGGAATAAGAWSTAYREHFGADGLEARLKDYLTATPVLIPAFAALLRGEPPPRGEQPLNQDTLQSVFVRTTQALADERPTVVLIEDLHFAPAEGRTVLTSLALAVPGHRVLLLGTMRPSSADGWLPDLERYDHVSRHLVSRLGPRDLVNLLREAFQSEILAEELSGRIAVKSDGNPFFVFEIIRGLREEHAIAQQRDGTWGTTERFRDIRVPSSVADLVNSRIAELDRESRELLEVASCCGFAFDPVLIAAASGVERVPALKRFGQIEKQHRLVRSAGRQLVFDHHQVQETLYEGIMEPLREAYHAELAGALEEREGLSARSREDPGGALALEICGHLLRGAQASRALRYLDASLAHLRQACLNEEAASLADRVLSVPGLLTGSRRAEILLARVSGLDFLGRREEQGEAIEEAIVLADAEGEAGLRSRALSSRGWLQYSLGHYEDSLRALGRAAELAAEAGDRRQEEVIEAQRAAAFQRLGDLESARASYTRWLELARERGDLEGEAGATGGLGNLHHMLGDYDEARKHFERYLTLATEVGDGHGQGVATGNLGSALRYLGRFEEALAHTRRRLEIARERNDRRGEGVAQANLGGLLVHLGDFVQARRVSKSSLRTLSDIQARREVGFAKNALGALAEAEGDAAEARRYFEEVLALRRELKDPSGTGSALASLGRLHLQEGRTEEARACLEEAVLLGKAHEVPDVFVLAACLLARIPGTDPAPALEAFRTWAHRLGHAGRMECRWLLWLATGDLEHREAARRLLQGLHDHAPQAYRDTMLQKVPLQRSIHES